MNVEEFKALNNLNLQTELLEAFMWDEEALDNFNIWLIDALNSSSDIYSLIYEIKTHYGDGVCEAIKKLFKSELESINDDKIKKGKIYEA